MNQLKQHIDNRIVVPDVACFLFFGYHRFRKYKNACRGEIMPFTNRSVKKLITQTCRNLNITKKIYSDT